MRLGAIIGLLSSQPQPADLAEQAYENPYLRDV